MPHYKKVKKTKIKLNNVVILKREDIIVKTSTAINSSYYSYKSDEEEARKRCVVVKMAELLHLPRKLRELQQQQQSLSLKDFVSVVETLNMQERDPESSSSSSPAASSVEGKKSKSKLKLKLKSPSFSKLIGKETNDKLRFMRKYWSMNHEKMMKRIVNGGACMYAVGSGEDEDGGWEEKNSDEEKEGYELCRRRILMGGRCKPLNVSGKLQYDETGILLPEDIST